MSRKRIPVMTMYEPHATLTVLGLKGVETRPRPMRYRGPLLIHSAKNTPRLWLEDSMLNPEIRDALIDAGNPEFHPGHIIGRVEVIDCKPVEELQVISTRERAMGNYAAKRFGIVMQRARKFKKPVKAKGKQGLWYRKGKT